MLFFGSARAKNRETWEAEVAKAEAAVSAAADDQGRQVRTPKVIVGRNNYWNMMLPGETDWLSKGQDRLCLPVGSKSRGCRTEQPLGFFFLGGGEGIMDELTHPGSDTARKAFP